jgi:hypothetical protein
VVRFGELCGREGVMTDAIYDYEGLKVSKANGGGAS